ncbi:MAG: MBL fold metallo-hydrolase [Fibromonadaceae bacterium]|jgi:beta-lactamase superfamily II metal-dependent hydrolase|nr:MBL fold metallo-hydrolase [Fibromonadaceae bacterium]
MFKWMVLLFVIGLMLFYYCNNREPDKEPEIEKIDSVVSVDKVDSTKSIDSGVSVAKKPAKMQVEMLDVGQGLAFLIQAPKCAVMYDAGTRKSGIDTMLANRKIEKLCSVILSHWHDDHAGGLPVLAKMIRDKKLKINRLLVSHDYHLKNKLRDSIVAEFERLNIPIYERHRGDTIGDFAPFTARVLWSQQNDSSVTANSASMVVHLSGGKKSFLFTGDLESKQETALLALEPNLKTYALQVGHHGSRHSSSAQFLAQLKPQKAYISAGKANGYKHPHKETVERLNAIMPDSNIFRTDVLGSVKFEMGI